MKRFVNVNNDGRILVVVDNKEYTDDASFEFDFPDDFDFDNQSNYCIIDNELVFNQRPLEEFEVKQELELKYRNQIENASRLYVRMNAVTLSDDDALSVSMLFDTWDETDRFLKDYIYQYKDDIYRCLQDHEKQATWTPDQAHSLFVRVRPEGEIQEWEPVQPGINEPYKKGDRVTHKGKTWVSDINNNIWEPGIYGWSEVII